MVEDIIGSKHVFGNQQANYSISAISASMAIKKVLNEPISNVMIISPSMRSFSTVKCVFAKIAKALEVAFSRVRMFSR